LLQVGTLFTFLARQMARQGDDIFVNRALFEQVVESLCVSDKRTEVDLEHEERQQALLELYSADGLRHFDEDALIRLAESAEFYRVCEVVYERRRQFDRIVSCYWRDPARAHLTFNYVYTVAADKSVSAEEHQKLKISVVEAVSELVKIDARKTAKLLLMILGISAEEIMRQLDSDEDVFKFLSGVFDFVIGTPDIQLSLEPSVYERYVEIMCRLCHPPSEIVSFLRSTSGYRLAEMLDICRAHSMADAVVYLLEKSGDVRGAFDIVFERVTQTVGNTLQRTSDSDDDAASLEAAVKDVIGLLQRGSRQLDQTQVETVWFVLLDFLMDSMKLLKTRSDIGGSDAGEAMKSVTRQVINAMMSHVALPAVLQRIVANEGGVAGHFGDVRDLLTGVLDACSYERTLLGTCARLVNHDLHCAIAAMTRASRRATSLRSDACVVCGRAALGASAAVARHSDDLVCFRCGHLLHRICLLDTATSPTTPRDHVTERSWKCPACSRSVDGGVQTADRAPVRSQATSPVHSATAAAKSSSQLSSVHVASVDRLRSVSRSPSRLTVLAELAQTEHSRAVSVAGHPRSKGPPAYSSILHNEQFALQLAVPPPPPND